MDFHVDDLKPALAKALTAVAKLEHLFENSMHGSMAMCSDSFGHGFVLLKEENNWAFSQQFIAPKKNDSHRRAGAFWDH